MVSNRPVRLAISYWRFSSAGQSTGSSELRQEQTLASYCAENGLTEVRVFGDRGKSAWKGKHRDVGALGEIVRLASTGLTDPTGQPVTDLVIEAMDRLSRE